MDEVVAYVQDSLTWYMEATDLNGTSSRQNGAGFWFSGCTFKGVVLALWFSAQRCSPQVGDGSLNSPDISDVVKPFFPYLKLVSSL